MASANSTPPSHICTTSTASFFRSRKEFRKYPEEQAPRLLYRFQQQQSNSYFAELPQELELLVLSICSKQGASDALFRLGLSCRYWHLRVRHQIENHPEGKDFRRAQEHRLFVIRNRQTPVEAVKQAIKQSRSSENVIFETTPEKTIAKLKSSFAHVVLKVRPSSKWSTDLGEALAARKACVTVLDMWPRTSSHKFVARAINVTSGGAYLALLLPSEGIPSEHVDDLAKAIKKNPVVCHVATLIGDPVARYIARGPDLSLLAACAENQIEGILFRFEYGNLRKEEAQLLVDVFRKFKTTVSLEIFSLAASQEGMDTIIQAVRTLNQSSPGKVALTCDGAEIAKAVGKGRFKELAHEGIRFVNTLAWYDDSSDSDHISDDDSDTIVGSTSNEEDS